MTSSERSPSQLCIYLRTHLACDGLSLSANLANLFAFGHRILNEGQRHEKRQARLTFICSQINIAMESELDMTVNVQNRIKELRIERGWTQQQLADAVGVSRQSINSIERNRYVPSLLLALTFAKVFACSTDELFTLEMKQ
jgi:putative transcriptional regulator